MRKHLFKPLLALALVLVCGNVWGEDRFVKVTSNADLKAGDVYSIVGSNSGKSVAIQPYVSGNNNCKVVGITLADDSFFAVDGMAYLVLGTTGGNWTLFDGNYYLYAVGGTGSNNYLKGTDNADNLNAQWSISIAEGGVATIKTADTKVARHTIKYNSSNALFSCYASGQQNIFLYKLDSETLPVKTPVINASDVTLECTATSGEVAYTITNPSDGVVLTATENASWISNVTVSSSKVTFTTTENTNNEARSAEITLSYAGASDKIVTVTQKKGVSTYNSIEALVAAGKPTGDMVTVTFNNKITGIQTSGDYRNGIFLDVNNPSGSPVEIYCKDVPSEWVVQGTISGTITCPWKVYGETWELCPTSWDGISYAAPVLDKFTVNYYSLGVKIGTEEVYDGQSVANAPEVTNVPTGWSFIDWTTNDAYKQSTTAPSFFGGVVTTDINLYAVFGKREGQISLTKMKADDSLSDGDNIVIVAHVDKADESGIKDYALYQETIKSSYVNKYPFVEDSEIIAADEKNWLTVNMKADGFSLGDKKNGYIYSAENNLHCGETEQIWTISTTEDGHFHLQSDNRYLSYRCDLSTNNYWRMGGTSLGKSGQTALDIYKFVAGTFFYATTFAQSQDVTISNVGFATAFMGFDATVSGADAYYVTVSDGMANLTKVEGVIPANTGVVLEAQNGGAATATFTESVATADDKAAAEGNMLVGSIVGKTFDAEGYYYYILSKGTGEKADAVGFYWDKNSYNGTQARCGANKAILAVPTTGGAATSSISIRFDGATMIENIVEVENNIYYDLQGRKVKNPSNGLYIVNGKKMLVK